MESNGVVSEAIHQQEKVIISIWEACLNHRPIKIDDAFSDLGGDLRIAKQIVENIERDLETSIPLVTFIQAGTIRNLIRYLHSQNSWKNLVLIQTKGEKYPFYCVPPSLSHGEILHDIANQLSEDQPLIGLISSGLAENSEPHSSISAMAKDYLTEIQTLQSQGPYLLGGICFGGLVAYEIAQQLHAQGHEVAFLGIMDSSFPPKQARTFESFIFSLRKFINNKLFNKELMVTMPGQRQRIRARGTQDTFLQERLNRVASAHIYSRAMYTSPPYPGVITLFSTERRIALKLRALWQKATLQEMEIVPIPGSHGIDRRGEIREQNQFINEQNITVLSQKLTQSLEKLGLVLH